MKAGLRRLARGPGRGYIAPIRCAKERTPMPSFDIVSRLDLAEVDNALAGLGREIATRFDFKGSQSKVTRQEGALTILADDELKLRQVQELLRMHMTRRKSIPARSISSRRRKRRARRCGK